MCNLCVLLQNHWTPLFAAARYGHAEAASLLLSAGANPHTPSQGIVVQWTEMGPLVQQVREGKGNDTVFKTAYLNYLLAYATPVGVKPTDVMDLQLPTPMSRPLLLRVPLLHW